MNIMTLMTMMMMMLTIIIMAIATTISKKSTIDREKMTPFECGFDPFYMARIPFSLKFFLIAVIFLIFDVEIAIILPSMSIIESVNPTSWSITLLLIIVILLVGLYYEWKQGALTWS